MRTIYKYEIKRIEDVFTLELPQASEILTIQAQHGRMQLWAIVDPKETKIKRTFICVETGKPFSFSDAIYLSTIQLFNESYVVHLFEIP